MGRKKNKQQVQRTQPIAQSDPYDLKASLKKLDQHQNNNGQIETNSTIQDKPLKRTINNSPVSNSETTGYSYERYDRLDDKFTQYKDSNESAHNQLRTELEKKISSLRTETDGNLDKKVSEKIFYGAVAVIVVIAGLIYSLSYSGLVSDTKKNNETIIKLENADAIQQKQFDENKSMLEELKINSAKRK